MVAVFGTSSAFKGELLHSGALQTKRRGKIFFPIHDKSVFQMYIVNKVAVVSLFDRTVTNKLTTTSAAFTGHVC